MINKKTVMIVVWIASVCLGVRQLEYLVEAIKSCLNIPRIDRIVLSIFTNNDLSALDKDIRLVIRKRAIKLKQFEHLELLAKEESYSDDTWITFLNDDDILLDNISEYWNQERTGFIANQYITIRKDESVIVDIAKNMTADTVSEYINRYTDEMIISEDFSGTSARYGIVKEYFSNGRKKEYVEDVRFMNYLQNRNALITEKVICVHRVTGETSLWRKDLADELEVMQKLVTSMIPIL